MLGERWMIKKAIQDRSTLPRTRYSNLENWEHRRQDKKTELYWINKSKEHPLSSHELHQQKWNFREIDYNSEPSNNGLDLGNPGFAFDKKLIKFLRHKSCVIINGKILDIRYEDIEGSNRH